MRHPLNTAGSFYVEDGCCTSCGMLETVAPELFGWSNDQHCFVKKQPQTPPELDNMLEAFIVADLDCIHTAVRTSASYRDFTKKA